VLISYIEVTLTHAAVKQQHSCGFVAF